MECVIMAKITAINLSYLQQYANDNDWKHEKEELLEVPSAPQYPLFQTHHQHSLTNTTLLLHN